MAMFDGTPGDDTLIGTALADVISGFDGKDHLSGGLGNDKLDGGGNNDYLNGGADNDTLIGGAGNDILFGDTGNDSMAGGLGDDIYVVDSAGDKLTELVGQGNDVVLSSLVDYTMGANIEGLALGSTGVNGIGNTLNNTISGNNLGNKLDGGLGNDELYGDAGADTLLGGSGNDTLDGGFHADKMTGGAGNDVYIVNDAGDVVTEFAGSGIDLVKAMVDGFILGANVENLTLTGHGNISGTGNDLANILTGNAGENVLIGGKGNDTLDGGGDRDTLRGGVGNDIYFVDDAADAVEEAAGEGKDTIHSTVSYQLKADQEIETLIFDSATAVRGVGNAFSNDITIYFSPQGILWGEGGNDTLTGSDASDTLFGGADNDVLKDDSGNDILYGGLGNDTLVAGSGRDELRGGYGNDAMTGGLGDDRYYVEDRGDTVTELAGQGTDWVYSYIADLSLSANVEYLILGSGALNGTGNILDNWIWGNAAANRLSGGAGLDIITGDAGNDTLMGGSGGDVLEGGLGADIINGEANNDYFRYAIENPGQLTLIGNDRINGFATGIDTIELTDLLMDFGIDPGIAVSGGYVLLTTSGSDTLVQFDQDGAAGAVGAVTLATVTSAAVAASDLLLDAFAVS